MSVDFSSKIKRVLYQNRFCEQKDFDIILSGTTDVFKQSEERKIFKFSNDFSKVEILYNSKRHSRRDRTVCERFNVWTVCSKIHAKGKSQTRPSLKIYLDKTDQWINVVQAPYGRRNFSACSFMKNIYVFGGFVKDFRLKSCYMYDKKRSIWIYKASMNDFKQHTACTVYKGKIVLTGGYDGIVGLSSVEAYDYYENKWDFLPRMIYRRYQHGAVCMGNKLYVIGGKYNATCEVFDSRSMKFTSIKQLDDNCYYSVSAVSIGDKILIFGSSENNILTYDVEKNEWYCISNCFSEFDGGFESISKLSVI